MQYDGSVCKLCGGAGLRPVEDDEPRGRRSSRPAPIASGENLAIPAMCYVLGPLTAMLFLVWPPHNQSKAVRFNALQSIFFFLGYVLILFMAGLFLPPGPREVAARAIQLTGMVCWLYVMWRTFRGDKVIIPLIGPMADKNS